MDAVLILAQIAVFMFTGFVALLLNRCLRTWILAVSSFLYGVSLFLETLTEVQMRGWPSLFLLIFMGTLLSNGLRDHLKVITSDL